MSTEIKLSDTQWKAIRCLSRTPWASRQVAGNGMAPMLSACRALVRRNLAFAAHRSGHYGLTDRGRGLVDEAMKRAAAQGIPKQATRNHDECPASGQHCRNVPNGPNGEMQCEYCGTPKSAPWADPAAHTLYTKDDADAPDVIKDRNGDIVLGLCKVCGRAEAELDEPCQPKSRQVSEDDNELVCCGGQDCGCKGVTKGEYRAAMLKPEQATCGTCGEIVHPDAMTGTTCACAKPEQAAGGGVAFAADDFYAGHPLPELHDDPQTNAEIIIGALIARLDVARRALADAAAMQVISPALAEVKKNAAWAMHETDPRRLLPRSAMWERPAVATPVGVTKIINELGHMAREGGISLDVHDMSVRCSRIADQLAAQCQVRKDTPGLDDSARLDAPATPEVKS